MRWAALKISTGNVLLEGIKHLKVHRLDWLVFINSNVNLIPSPFHLLSQGTTPRFPQVYIKLDCKPVLLTGSGSKGLHIILLSLNSSLNSFLMPCSGLLTSEKSFHYKSISQLSQSDFMKGKNIQKRWSVVAGM